MISSVRFTVRGFLKGVRKFEDNYNLPEDVAGDVIEGLAPKHLPQMAKREIDLLEIEFLDEPDKHNRFIRFGTNPDSMNNPVAVKLDEPKYN